MKKQFSNSWKASVKKRKQVKYVKKAPLHIKNKFLSAHLSKELITKLGTRNITIRKGDKVKILRGSHKGKTGKIAKVNLKFAKIYVEGIELTKTDGSKSQLAINPSNVVVIEASMDDRKRKKSVERKTAKKA